jgi:hypothetical protein
VDHVSTTDQRDAGGARPAPSGTSSGGNGFQVGQLGSSVFRGRPARRRPGSTLVATRRHYDQVCVFDAPGGAPHRIAPTAFCLIYSVRRRIAHRRDAWSGSEPGKPPPEGRRPPKRSGAIPCCRSSKPALRRVARERARLRPPGPDEQVAARPARGGCGKGTQRTELPRWAFSVSVPVMMLAEARLTASDRSLSPEHPEVSGQRKRWCNRNIQLSLPFG